MDDLKTFELPDVTCGGQGTDVEACACETPRKRGRPRAFDPDVVLETVLELFWMRGFANTSLDDISAATGVSRPSLAATFGDKEALYLKAMERYRNGISGQLDTVLQCNGPGDNLRGIVNRYFDVMISSYTGETEDCLGCAFMCTALNEAPRHESIMSVLQGTIEEFDARFEHFFTKAQEMGHIGSNQDPKVMSQMITSLTSSLAVRARAGASREDLKAIVDATTSFLFP
ncbi:TetR/AcrR family transcriptional regulator [Asticcacaulis sp.]|uniref:TetR/AcrR family transcriptional regulator n=1 Tax=Asticcacaulis sp. TaxID=1872648 RepID=UPI002CEEC728|nr:TetR/AcrR family transcriptional regulator [Asticcacaulis sp.]HTM80695.1 TetR/AcrR family transcriptional regulator [Asticcacaulis sp.]